jgi:hypothetical protein
MSSVPAGVLIGALAALIAAGLTFVTTRWQLSRQFDFEYDRRLREHRLTAYGELWRLLEPLSIYEQKSITVGAAAALSARMTRWYYRTGGLVLSVAARDAYFPVQNILAAAGGLPFPGDHRLDRATMDDLKARGSALRTATTRDVGTRADFLGRR